MIQLERGASPHMATSAPHREFGGAAPVRTATAPPQATSSRGSFSTGRPMSQKQRLCWAKNKAPGSLIRKSPKLS